MHRYFPRLQGRRNCITGRAGIWEVYQKTGDRTFLEEHVEARDKYLTGDMVNRDANNNGLLEWLTEPDVIKCKCGDSGLDNSPRFDFDEEMDAVDFSSFLAHDALYLSYIYHELGREDDATKWQTVYNHTKEKMNVLLWDEETGVYYDRLMNGQLSRILTPATFLPLFAGIPSKVQAERMVKVLTDKALLWTPCPLFTPANLLLKVYRQYILRRKQKQRHLRFHWLIPCLAWK